MKGAEQMSNYCMKCGKPIELCTCGGSTAAGAAAGRYPQGAFDQQGVQNPYQQHVRRGQPNVQNMQGAAQQTQQPQQQYAGYYSQAPQQPQQNYYQQQPGNSGMFQNTMSAPKYSFSGQIGEPVLSEGEVMVRSYMIGKYPFNSGNCTLYVTNKRVILKEYYNWLLLKHYEVSDLNIENVHGLRCGFGRNISSGWTTLALASLVFSIVAFSSGGSNAAVGVVMLLLSLILFGVGMLSTHSDLSIIGTDEHSPISMDHNGGGFLAKLLPEFGVLKCRPTKDLDDMAVELGSCLYDLRTFGDTAIQRWKR